MQKDKIEQGVKLILEGMGEDINREGLSGTPERMARAYAEMFGGYEMDPVKLFKSVFHDEAHKEMVIVKDIPFYSTCEHHMVPFHGKAHIGYIPNGTVIGLSKVARLVEVYAKRLQIQERLVSQIADDLMKYLKPDGCMVVVSAEHLCMSMRGIKKPGHSTVTSAVRGCFQKQPEVKEEFLKLVQGGI